MKRTRKALSLILTLCMIVSLFAGLTVTASADAPTTGLVDGVLTIASATAVTDKAATEGWSWDNSTLTLSGVNLTQIVLSVPATIVLEGANRVSSTSVRAISASSALTIKGSGTLEAVSTGSGTEGIYIDGDALTIESGYIVASGYKGIEAAGITITGGYISASGSNFGISVNGSYLQSGGYVKATSDGYMGNGLYAYNNSATVSGGYLEAVGTDKGIKCVTFTNSGGVVKATADTVGISATTLSFDGGVTIASVSGSGSSCDALGGSIVGSNGEKCYPADLSSPTALSTTGQSFTHNSVIVAKEANHNDLAGGLTLDGTYLSYTGEEALDAISYSITVTGGSYLETSSTDYNTFLTTGTVTVGITTTQSIPHWCA